MDVRSLLPENHKPLHLVAADHGGFATLRLDVFADADAHDIDAMPRTVVDVTVSEEPAWRGGRLVVHAAWPESFGQIEGHGVPFVNRIMGRSGLALDTTPMTTDEAREFVAALVRKVHNRLR